MVDRGGIVKLINVMSNNLGLLLQDGGWGTEWVSSDVGVGDWFHMLPDDWGNNWGSLNDWKRGSNWDWSGVDNWDWGGLDDWDWSGNDWGSLDEWGSDWGSIWVDTVVTVVGVVSVEGVWVVESVVGVVVWVVSVWGVGVWVVKVVVEISIGIGIGITLGQTMGTELKGSTASWGDTVVSGDWSSDWEWDWSNSSDNWGWDNWGSDSPEDWSWGSDDWGSDSVHEWGSNVWVVGCDVVWVVQVVESIGVWKKGSGGSWGAEEELRISLGIGITLVEVTVSTIIPTRVVVVSTVVSSVVV